MDFAFSPEQDNLRDTVRQFFAKHAAGLVSRDHSTLDRPLWSRLSGELGLTALAIDEAYGGFGATLVEVAIAVEEAGRVLLPLPYLSTVVAAAALSASPNPAILAGIAAGTTIATLAIDEPGVGFDPARLATTARRDGDGYVIDGVKEHVLDGDIADTIIVAATLDGSPALFVVAAANLHRTPLTTVDQTRPVARLTLDATPATLVSPPDGGAAAVGYAVDVLHTLLAVESIGVAAASLDLTVSYLNTREQFGVRLATFQALRHRIADLVVALDAATSTTWYAVRTAGPPGSAGQPSGASASASAGVVASPSSAELGIVASPSSAELGIVAPMAKLVAAEAAYLVTAESIQLHGGIGFTWEHPAHRFFKRATVTRLTYGSAAELRRLIGARAAL